LAISKTKALFLVKAPIIKQRINPSNKRTDKIRDAACPQSHDLVPILKMETCP
jgi:hypothetical protein